jgi:cytochrome c oxidase subunit 1
MGSLTLDLTVHDTYFVIEYKTMAVVLFGLHLLCALIYFLLRKYTVILLVILHFILEAPLLVFGFLTIEHYAALAGVPRRYYTNSNLPFDSGHDTMFYILIALLLLFGISQFIFLANVGVSIFRMMKNKPL